jgi:hypothetical protein
VKLVKLETDPITKVYAGLAAEAEDSVRNYRRPARRFRASETADCRRKLWYRLAGFIPEPTQPWLSLVGDSGQFHHDYARHVGNHYGMGLTGFTEEGGKQTEDPYVVRTFTYDGRTFDISARMDAGIDLGFDTPAVVEIKSMSQFDFQAVQQAFVSGGEEKVMEKLTEDHPNYQWQGNTTAMVREWKYVYLWCVGRSNNSLGLSDAGFGKAHEWAPLAGRHVGGAVWEVEDKDRENILQKLADVDRTLEDGTPPPPDYTDGSKPCNQCAFWVYCHGKKKRAKYPIAGVMS